MAKKDRSRPSAESGAQKKARRRLEKLEARLSDAKDRRDRAQARVDALTIMIGELGSSLSAAMPAAEPSTSGKGGKGRATAAATPASTAATPASTAAKPASTAAKPASTAAKPARRRTTASNRTAQGPTPRTPGAARTGTTSRTTRSTRARTTRRRGPESGAGPGEETTS